MEHRYEVEVTAQHTDELGHLNHVQAVEILQNARLALYDTWGLRDNGLGSGYGTVVVNIDVSFRRECFLGDRLTVVTRPVSVGNKSFVVAQAILRSDGEIAVEGKITSVVMEMAARAIVPVPAPFLGYFSRREKKDGG